MAMIADAFVGKFLKKLGDLIQDRAMMQLGVEEDLRQLQRRLTNIKLVLVDAERKRIRDKAIDAWVKQLKGVLYDVDDLIDDCIINGANLKQPTSSTSSVCISLFSCCSTIHVNMTALKIQEINNSLDEIYKNRSQFNLCNIIQDDHVLSSGNRMKAREIDGVKDPNVVGVHIENATNKLVSMMFDDKDQRHCLVFAICGKGGIGKTTLAQYIFNDKRILSKTKVWLCISQVYDNIKLLQELIRGVGGNPSNATSRAELLFILVKAVHGKDIFLVLDDVWLGQEGVWNDLLRKIMLRHQGEGPSRCRVLLTSTNENVAMKMGVMHDHIHHVDELSKASRWELFCKLVFGNLQESDIDSRLKDVGLQIVEKCKDGFPLTIKVISGVLKTKGSNVTKWKNLLSSWSMSEDSEVPGVLTGALYLSYEELPSHLKQCFLYLSLFPEDFEYKKSDIVRMWVAEGFIQSKGNILLEEIAEGYYEELMSRNIIQAYYSQKSKMHDIVRSFGQYLSKDESCFYEGGKSQLISSLQIFKVRRICLDNINENASILQQIICKESLRTLLCFGRQRFEINDVLVKFSYLRILSLDDSEIRSLPENIGGLIHLRLLSLCRTEIYVLPNSISCLKNLQSLDVSDCDNLRALPQEITQLCNLRHLVTLGTKLSHLPKGIERLKQLNELSEFIVGNRGGTADEEEGCSLEELRSLSQLRKNRVTNLHRAKVTNDCSALLANHSHLTKLKLYFSPSVDDLLEEVSCLAEEEEKDLKKVLEVLMPPPPSLIGLEIYSYYGRSFPDYLMQASSMENHFPNLTSLALVNCSNVSKLPPLGQVPHLESLQITCAKSVIHIGPEFLGVPQTGGSMQAFPKLKELTFAEMSNWKEWEEFDEQIISTSSSSIAPCRTLLRLFNCEKLRALPNWLSHSNIRHLELRSTDSITSISNLPHLERLIVAECPALTRVEGLESLRTIELQCWEMERLPKWLSGPIKQRDEGSPYHDLLLELEFCRKEEVMRNCCEGGLDWPIIQLFHKVSAMSGSGRMRFEYSRGPSGYSFTKECF